ncbi:hypothetical protein STZ1_10125 [Bacillus subtilis]
MFCVLLLVGWYRDNQSSLRVNEGAFFILIKKGAISHDKLT